MQTRFEELSSMSEQKLISLFLSNYGEICENDFTVPSPVSRETADSHFAFMILSERPVGRKALNELQLKFRRGEIDKKGNILSRECA